LKQIFFILTFFIGLNFTSLAQTKSGSDNGITQAKYLRSYPNPANAVVNFEFLKPNSRLYSIQILNSIGKRVYELKNLPPVLSVDIKAEKFYRGIYIYQLVDKDGVVAESGKFLVIN
jgi:hypothetical protein